MGPKGPTWHNRGLGVGHSPMLSTFIGLAGVEMGLRAFSAALAVVYYGIRIRKELQ